MKRMQVFRWGLFLCIQTVFSADLTDIYKVDSTDISLSYLNIIFGPLTGIGPNATANAFSFIVVKLLPVSAAIAFMLASYVSYAGTLKSAFEGHFLGQRWGSNFLIPVRTFIGFSLLVPDINGYAYIQKIFITLILSGVGLANTIWEMIIDNYSKGQGFVSQATTLSDADASIARQAINMATTYAYFQNRGAAKGYEINYTSSSQTNVGCYLIDELGTKSLIMNFFSSDQPESISSQHFSAIQTLVTTAMGDPVITYAGMNSFQLDPSSSEKNKQAWLYSYVQVANYLFMNEVRNTNENLISKKGGWIQAGSFYWNLAKKGSSGDSASNYLCGTGYCDTSAIIDLGVQTIDNTLNTAILRAYLSNFSTTLYNIDWKTVNSSSSQSTPWYKAQSKLRGMKYNELMLNLDIPEDVFSVDPLLIFIKSCQTMLYNILITLTAVMSTLMLICLLGVARWSLPGKGIILLVISLVFSLILPLLLMIVPPAALGGYYIPLIPFIIFSFGVLGWLLKVIEAIVAAPFIAMIIIQPTDDEFGKAQHSFGMLANIVFRPAMMLIGFGISLKLLTIGYLIFSLVYLSYINFLFDTLGPPDLYCILFMLLSQVVVTLMVILVNRVFSIIYLIPDRVFSWIGIQSGGDADVQSAVSEVKKGAQEGITAISNILKIAQISMDGIQKNFMKI